MTIADFLPNADQLKALQGVEKDLVKNRRNSRIGGFVALAAVVVQAVAAIQGTYLANLGQFLSNLISGNWDQLFGDSGLDVYEFTGLAVVAGGFVIYFGYGWLSFFRKESEEPFRYTFWIDKFDMLGSKEQAGEEKEESSCEGIDRLDLLHHDVKERLNQRIRRLSLLAPADAKDGKEQTENRSPSNIKISGQCAVRDDGRDTWLHIMPTIRIGPGGTPETLAQSIKFTLVSGKKISASDYGLIVEQVYSSVATEIYRQIKEDIEEKIKLFPFGYLRATALVNEAVDFERSNTIDAYDHAIDLYHTATRYFTRNKIVTLSRWLARMPIAWRFEIGFTHREARTFIGYARCMIYRRTISALSGLREQNTLFEIPTFINDQLEMLELINRHVKASSGQRSSGNRKSASRGGDFLTFLTFPRDNWLRLLLLRPKEALFEAQRRLLAEAHIVSALTSHYLGDIDDSHRHLARSRAVAPVISQESALYFLAAGEIEPEINPKLLHFQKATELQPDFEIAQFQLAYHEEMKLRMEGDLSAFRIESVVKSYQRVSTINPGNIASQLNRGYLHWLAGELKEAQKAYHEGREKKTIVAATFVGDLTYGLARIAAEDDKLETAYELYSQAIAADPAVAAYTQDTELRSKSPLFSFIGDAMLDRYRRFLQNVSANIDKARSNPENGSTLPLTLLKGLHGHALNDYGNACLTFFHRFGDERCLDEAIDAFEQARDENPNNSAVSYNLYNAYSWKGEFGMAGRRLEQAQELSAAWPKVATEFAQSTVREQKMNRDQKSMEMDVEEEKKRDLETELRAKRQQIEVKRQTLARVERSSLKIPGIAIDVHQLTVDIGRKFLAGEIKKLELGVRALETKIEESTEEVNEAASRKTRAEELFDQAVNSAVATIVTSTKLAPLFAGRDDSPEDKIKRLLDEHRRVHWEKLSYDDVDALMTLASVLQHNDPDTALALCRRIASTYRRPNNFDVASLIYDIVQAKKAQGEIVNEDLKLRQTLQYILASEPAYFTALLWCVRVFGPQTIEDIYNELPPDYHQRWDQYHCLMGHVYRFLGRDMMYSTDQDKVSGYFDRAISEFRRPLLANPDRSRFHTYIADTYRSKACYYRDTLKRQSLAENLFKQSLSHYQNAYDLDQEKSPYCAADVAGACEKLDMDAEAKRHYQLAIRRDGGIPEFRVALAMVERKLGSDGKSLSNSRRASDMAPWIARYHETQAQYEDDADAVEAAMRMAIRLDPGYFGYYNRLANFLFDRAEYERSINWYEAAIHRAPDDAILRSNLAGACEKRIAQIVSEQSTDTASHSAESGSPAISLADKAINALQRALVIDASSVDYTQRLSEVKKRRRWLSAYAPNVLKRIPVVTPIAAEIAGDLIPLVEMPGSDQLEPELSRLFEDMRRRILDRYGVPLPGVRIRGNETDLADGRYILQLMETPVRSGVISLTRRFCPLPASELADLPVEVEDEDVDPVTGEPGSWIEEKDWQTVEDAGFELWAVIQYLVRDLEAVLERNLADFMGNNEVVEAIKIRAPDRLEAIKAAPGGVPALTGVLRGLLAERVPITAFDTICKAFVDARAVGTGLTEIVESLRSNEEIRDKLPGVSGDARIYTLADDFEDAIRTSLRGDGSSRVLGMGPELCQDALAAVRNTVDLSAPSALLTKAPGVRPFVRKLVELEFPELPVVTSAERIDAEEDQVAGEISLADQQ